MPPTVLESEFTHRHVGPSPRDIQDMLAALGYASLEELSNAAVPADIRLNRSLHLPPGAPEQEVLAELRALSEKNHVRRSLIGQG